MRYSPRLFALGSVLLLAGAAYAQNFSAPYGVLSGVQNGAGITLARTSYAFDFSRSAADAATFINSFELIPGTSFDPDIALNLPGTTLNAGRSNEYTLGTPLTGDRSIRFDDLAVRDGGFGSNVAPGFYDFQIRVRGGTSATATDQLALFGFSLEIVPTFSLAVAGSPSQSSVPQGGSFLANVSITNPMARGAILNGIYAGVPAFSTPGDGMDAEFFDGSGLYFTPGGSVVTSNETVASAHSRVDARSDQRLGSYISNYGIIAGFYSGDQYSFEAGPKYAVTVTSAVPEPATFAALAFGGLALLRRRRV
ncbi:PEP-CTERM sorting domain-containing protein [bacterium]|nr:MAG: PEP-CTERM sorting domain-containing protein [bacterium]